MNRWVLYQGVFGCWGGEPVNESQQVIAESSGVFVKDAKAHGYTGDSCADSTFHGLRVTS